MTSTHELLMTFLYTARIRGLNPQDTLKKALNMLARNPDTDIAPLLVLPSKEQPAGCATPYLLAVKTEPLPKPYLF
ncbi:MAG: hypothetical protein WC071_06375 [Victivallaceae bacterium]